MKRQRAAVYTGPTCKGIDVSHWQGTVDWDLVVESPELAFAYIRVGDGKDIDTEFVNNWKRAQKAKAAHEPKPFYIGPYHYLRADRDGKTQAKLLEGWLSSVGYSMGHLPPVADLEDGAAKNLKGGIFEQAGKDQLPIEMVLDETLEYLEEVERLLSVKPMIYTGQTFHWWVSQARPHLAPAFAKYQLWTPSYVTKAPFMPVDAEGKPFPWSDWTIWQYTSSGDAAGVKTKVDMNYFRGDLMDLRSLAVHSHFPAIPEGFKPSTAVNPGVEVTITIDGCEYTGTLFRKP